MNQSSLFDPVARAEDPGTSWAAAKSITPGRTEQKILALFKDYDRLTDDEIATLVDAYAPTVKSARSRLSNAGLLVDSGETRMSYRGRKMIVWRKP